MSDHYEKYLKYKAKYLNLKKLLQVSGVSQEEKKELTLEEKKVIINNIVIDFIETYYGDGKDEAKQFFQSDINNLDKLLELLLKWNGVNSNASLSKYNKDPKRKDDLAVEMYDKMDEFKNGWFPVMWFDDGILAIRILLDPEVRKLHMPE